MTITESNQPSIPQLTNGDDNSKSNATSKSEKTPTKGDEVKSGDEEKEKRDFVKNLQHFHDTKGTPFARFPKISGKEVDLYRLYTEVTSRGGWLKVNQRNDWDEVLEEVGFSNSIVNAPVAIKYIYLRYLDRYEKLHFHGEEPERADDEEDENRHKRWNARLLHNVPATYNYHQHSVSDAQRAQHKLSTDLYRNSEYDKLFLSLMSPLPNEQDFAINVCTLMSNEGKHTLKIDRCPKLIDILLAHAGLFQHYTLRDIFTEYYSKIRKHSLQSFWSDGLQERPQILELSFDDYLTSSDEKVLRAAEVFAKNLQRKRTAAVECREEDEDCTLEVEELSFLSLGRGLGTHEYIGQRIAQISTIIRNLSFIEDNVPVLARNRTLVRFLVMSANIRWSNLHHMGLDILGNLALELELSDPSTDDLTRCLLSTITEGLESQDRGVIISCLEVLYKLCQKASNEDHLHKCLDKKVYRQVCLFLCLNDIMLLLYTLECIYALSLLGERSCNAIVQVQGVVDTLVSLVTVEAQSYGADGCILMRVVETVSGSANMSLASHHIINSSSLMSNTTNFYGNSSSSTFINTFDDAQKVCTSIPPLVANSSPIKAIVPTQVTPSAIAVPAASPKMILSTPSAPVVAVNSTATFSAAPITVDSQNSPQNATNVSAKHAQQQVIQENEQFALAWLRATFEPAPNLNTRIEQQELYKMYITASSKLGRRGVVSPVHFPRCVRSVFGGSVGPNPMKLEQVPSESPQFYYEGIKIRAKPLPIVHKGIVVTASATPAEVTSSNQTPIQVQKKVIVSQQQQQQPGSILVAQLNQSKSVVINKKTPTLQKAQQVVNHQLPENHVIVVSGSQPQMGHQVTNSAIVKPLMNANQSTVMPAASVASSASSSSLIKSLLANKVTSPVNDQSAGSSVSTCLIAPNVNLHQVAQRQHLQKQKEMAQQKQTGNGALPTPVINQVPNATPIKTNITMKAPIATNVITSSVILEKKVPPQDTEHGMSNNWDPVPPLAPLSGLTNQRQVIVNATVKLDDDSDSTGNNSVASSIASTNQNAFADENSLTSFEGVLVQNNQSSACSTEDENSSKDSLNKTSQVVSANKMLADLLERKSLDPPMFAGGGGNGGGGGGEKSLKRRLDSVGGDSSEESSPPPKKPSTHNAINASTEVITIDSNEEEDEPASAAPSANAAKLFAELAASALEDEDLDEETPHAQAEDVKVQNPAMKTVIVEKKVHQQTGDIQATTQQQQQQMITVPVPLQRQIIMSGAQPQMILSQGGATSLGTQTTATIKTESGYQTVPVILQHSAGGTNQLQLTKTGQLVQPVQLAAQPQTQYVLATNPQGQTYVVAAPQQSHPLQTLLVTQSPQQQGTGTKTIIILQQPSASAGTAVTSGAPQKIIMTQQGQQMVVTQMQRPMQHHVIVNQLPNSTTSITSAPAANQPSVTLNTVIANAQPPNAATTTATLGVEKKTPPQQIIVNTQHQTPPTTNVPATSNSVTMVTKVVPEVESPAKATTPPALMQVKVNSVPPTPPKSPSPQQGAAAAPKGPSPTPQTPKAATPPPKSEEEVDPNWWLVCEWRGCPRKKYKTLNEVITHACNVHCPDGLDATADIYCQWGPGPNFCDNVPRRRFSLMTHLMDRHCNKEAMQAAAQRRIAGGSQNSGGTHQAHPVTLIRNTGSPNPGSSAATSGDGGSASPALSTSSSGSLTSAHPNVAGSAAMQAIKRHHSMEFIRTRERLDDNEGPVTKSIRLTASLILRNLVNYSGSAKRMLRYYEPHLAGVALSNVESSRTIAQVLFEMNETHPV